MSFFEELKRRNVFRVGIAYLISTWLLIQVSDTVFPRIGLPESAVTLVIAIMALGFISAMRALIDNPTTVGASLCSRLASRHPRISKYRGNGKVNREQRLAPTHYLAKEIAFELF